MDALDERLVDIVAAAILSYEGLNQADAARILNISQSGFSRLYQEAGRRQFIDVRPRLNRDSIDAADERLYDAAKRRVQAARRRASCAELQARILSDYSGTRLRNAVVAPSVWNDQGEFDQLATRSIVAHFAADRIAAVLDRTSSLGTLWGDTLSRVAQEAARLEIKSPPGGVAVYPLAGEPTYFTEGDYPEDQHASYIAEQFSKAINGKDARAALRLSVIPMFIPKAADLETLHAYFCRIPVFCQVFGTGWGENRGPDALVRKLDAVLTSAAVCRFGRHHPWFEFLQEELGEQGQLDDLIVGDFGGVLVPRSGLSAEGKQLVEAINERSLLPRKSDYFAIAEQALLKGTPGVMLVAEGAEKAEVVRYAIQQNWVNEIAVDASLGERLCRG